MSLFGILFPDNLGKQFSFENKSKPILIGISPLGDINTFSSHNFMHDFYVLKSSLDTPPPTILVLVQAINQNRTNNISRRNLTLMYGGLHQLVFSPPAGFALTLYGELSRRRGRLGCSRLGRARHRPSSRLGCIRGWIRERGRARTGFHGLGRRRPRQPLGRDL